MSISVIVSMFEQAQEDCSTSSSQSKDGDINLGLWDYFSKEKNERAKCLKCEKILRRSNGTTSGLHRHLLGRHRITVKKNVAGKGWF